MSKIQDSLLSLFQNYRIVLWYDETKAFSNEFDELLLPSVNKLVVQNNEFAIKHTLYMEKPAEKFLLFLPYEHPHADDNWLLDVELANYVFHTDQEAMTLQELGLNIGYRSWITPHLDFFKSKERLNKFIQIKTNQDTETQLSLRIAQVILGATSNTMEELMSRYAILFNEGKSEDADKELAKYGTATILWEQISDIYEYNNKQSGIYDFLLEAFQKSFKPTSNKAKVNNNAEVLVSKWKDMRSFEETFKSLSKRIETDLQISTVISTLPLDQLVNEDLFECVERQIIRELTQLVIHQSLNSDKIEQTIKIRETKFWINTYSPYYNAIENAIWITDEVKLHANNTIADYSDGFKKFTSSWYVIDQYYRMFIQYYRETNQSGVLAELYQKIHKIYSNTWLTSLSDNWQATIEKSGNWYQGDQLQTKFFNRDVKSKYLDKNNKLFVIISDGLRYECGRMLNDQFNTEMRFTSTLDYQITNLPSYTQLGMAAMLPHKELNFADGESVLADGKSTLGLQNRQKILQESSGVRAAAILAEDLMRLAPKGEEAQNLIQNNDLIYVYHNRIDKLGDDKTTEDKVIEASREEIQFLMDVVRKISNMNGNNMIITSDHGFIYQHEELLESDFTDAGISGDIQRDSRRYVIGNNLEHNQNVLKFNARDLNINSDREILLPKGINRLRKQGSGSRYVHGGMSLQETVVPILFVTKKRVDTVSKVEVDILNKTNNRITTNIHTVKFYQMHPVGTKFIARTIKSYFAIIDGQEEDKKVISDIFTYTFDLTNERSEEREIQNRFTLSTTVKRSHNVYLIVEEKVDKSNKWITISKFPYNLLLVMENDFDDF